MSEHGRPYDPNQYNRLLESMLAVNPATGEASGPVVTQPPVESRIDPIPANPDAGSLALDGIRGVLARGSREEKIERLQHRVNTARAAAYLIEGGAKGQDVTGNPIQHAKKRAGWEGIYQHEWSDGKARVDPNDLTKMGQQILGKPSVSINKSPNPFRPVTWSQKFAVKRLGYLFDKRNIHLERANWRETGLSGAGERTLKDALRDGATNRFTRRHIKKAIKAQDKFDKIAAGQNFAFRRGRRKLDALRADDRRERGLPDLVDPADQPKLGPIPIDKQPRVVPPGKFAPFVFEFTPPPPETARKSKERPRDYAESLPPERVKRLLEVDKMVKDATANTPYETWRATRAGYYQRELGVLEGDVDFTYSVIKHLAEKKEAKERDQARRDQPRKDSQRPKEAVREKEATRVTPPAEATPKVAPEATEAQAPVEPKTDKGATKPAPKPTPKNLADRLAAARAAGIANDEAGRNAAKQTGQESSDSDQNKS